MTIIKKNIFTVSLLLLINTAFAQIKDESLKINPMLELLGINAKTLGLKGNAKEMRVQQFFLDAKGNKIIDSVAFSNLYKFDKDGLTQEFEQNYNDLQSKTQFYSYTNKGYISHIDIESANLAKDKDSTGNDANQVMAPDFSSLDFKYVKKKNILYKGEDLTIQSPKKTNLRTEYFYHFNDDNQIEQIDYQSSDLSSKFIYGSNDLVKETQTYKSGVLSDKNFYKYDRSNRLINITVISPENTTKYPNSETAITYKYDSSGNIIEKKMMTYHYSPEGTKTFFEGYLYFYNYTYL